ncbi:MAG: ATPase, T2SS/T4P/T4SS family, partial [Verrucomicrobiales bacterium]
LVLIGGPTGSGKSTTLAALIDHINRTTAKHVLTVEDPIEVIHEHKKSLVSQREVGTHTASFQNALRSTLRQDPYALETAFVSVITFGSTASELVPLTELTAFQAPNLTAGGSTGMGDALRLVAEIAATQLTKNSVTSKGDWKPMVFIMTDGAPTDDWQKGLARFKQEKWGIVVACAVNGGDITVLQQIAGEAVVKLDTTDPTTMAKFFKWVSASVSYNGKSVETGGKEVEDLGQLPPPPPEIRLTKN